MFGSLLGMSEAEMESLVRDKIIGRPPKFQRRKPTRTDLIRKQQSGWFDPDYRAELAKWHRQERQ